MENPVQCPGISKTLSRHNPLDFGGIICGPSPRSDGIPAVTFFSASCRKSKVSRSVRRRQRMRRTLGLKVKVSTRGACQNPEVMEEKATSVQMEQRIRRYVRLMMPFRKDVSFRRQASRSQSGDKSPALQRVVPAICSRA